MREYVFVCLCLIGLVSASTNCGLGSYNVAGSENCSSCPGNTQGSLTTCVPLPGYAFNTRLPPQAIGGSRTSLTSNTLTVAGRTFVASASSSDTVTYPSHSGNQDPSMAFDYSWGGTGFWMSADWRYSTVLGNSYWFGNGNTPSTQFSTATVDGVNLVYGEWLQLVVSTPVIVTHFALGGGSRVSNGLLVGSNDGSTWTTLGKVGGMFSLYAAAKDFPVFVWLPFTRFRLIITRTTNIYFAVVTELALYDNTPVALSHGDCTAWPNGSTTCATCGSGQIYNKASGACVTTSCSVWSEGQCLGAGNVTSGTGTLLLSEARVGHVLVVGGGGGGSNGGGGYNTYTGPGGGAGGLVFYPSFTFDKGFYSLVEGFGGPENTRGGDTAIQNASGAQLFLAIGGGSRGWSGGSGSGGFTPGGTAIAPGLALASNVAAGSTWVVGGNTGGTALTYASFPGWNAVKQAGGGGAGAPGGSVTTGMDKPATGGNGLRNATVNGVVYDFATVFGAAYTSADQYVGGGGGGGGYCWTGTGPTCNYGSGYHAPGGLGGGGYGIYGIAATDARVAASASGLSRTGGGGGGARGDGYHGGEGGSGLILIAWTSTVTSCPAGSYSTASAVTTCTSCTAGTYSTALAATACTNCVAGTYFTGTGAQASATCARCGAGAYSTASGAASGATCTNCTAGTYSTALGITTGASCLACVSGTFAAASGAIACSPCTANFFCPPSTTAPQQCPSHTWSAPGASSRLDCACDKGFRCRYTKRITVILTLNCTLEDFNNNVGNVRTEMIAAIAAAAHVDPSQVVINGVLPHSLARHRRDTQRISVTVSGATGMDPMQKCRVVTAYEWREAHDVRIAITSN